MSTTGTAAQTPRLASATYLDAAASAASRDLYARLGYAETGIPLTLPGHDGPSFWPMWRNPNQHPTK
ncbi:MAG: hypothetical protein ACRDT6_20290 [Micromonosporaceae bacterium]